MSFLRHGESIDPMNVLFHWEQASGPLPVLIGLDEFQPAIPWQVALQQSLPPLRRPRTILQNKTSPYNDLSANGNNPLNSVSQHKGALQPTFPLHPNRPRRKFNAFNEHGFLGEDMIKVTDATTLAEFLRGR